MTLITPEQAYNAAKLLFPNSIEELRITRNTPGQRGTGNQGNAICGRGDPIILEKCEIEWPEGVTEWPNPKTCQLCRSKVAIGCVDNANNLFCGSECREMYRFRAMAGALEDAVRRISHLGGNPRTQENALILVGPMRKTPVEKQP